MHGFLLWEYERLSLFTRLTSSKFHYDANLDADEADKGAVCVSFSIQSLFGEELRVNYTISVDGQRARTQCKSQYINLLKRIVRAFENIGTLPRFTVLRGDQSADDVTRKDTIVRVTYLAVVLLQWFTRVESVIENEMMGDGGVITPTMSSVSENRLPRATWI